MDDLEEYEEIESGNIFFFFKLFVEVGSWIL